MALKHIKVPTANVPVPGNDPIVVRGLSLDDILRVVREHDGALGAIFDDVAGKVKSGATGLSDDLIANYAMTMVQSAPGLAAALIALAADEDPTDVDALTIASRLPATIQIDALIKAGQLTFSLEGGLKKVIEIVVGLAKGTTTLMSELQALPNGSGGSADK